MGMEFHNRMVRKDLWTDYTLMDAFGPTGVLASIGVKAIADDSGCLEDRPGDWKCMLFPSREDVTAKMLADFRDWMVKQGRYITYQADGKPCVYIVDFHNDQPLRSPNPPKAVPLPPWIRWVSEGKDSMNRRRGHYEVGEPVVPRNGKAKGSPKAKPAAKEPLALTEEEQAWMKAAEEVPGWNVEAERAVPYFHGLMAEGKYPEIDLLSVFEGMKAWVLSNPEKNTYTNWLSGTLTWVKKSKERGQNLKGGGSGKGGLFASREPSWKTAARMAKEAEETECQP